MGNFFPQAISESTHMPPRRSVGAKKRKSAEPTVVEPLKIRFVDKDDISDNLKCSICQEIFSYPIALQCGHVYCEGCIKSWIRSSVPPTCPECRDRVDLRFAHKDLIAHKFLDSLSVYCAYLGCAWIGRMDALEGHARECEFNPAKLPDWMLDQKKPSTVSDDLPSEGTTSLRMRLYKKDKSNLLVNAASGDMNIFSMPTNTVEDRRLSNAIISNGGPIQSVEDLSKDLINSADVIRRNTARENFINISSDDD